MSTTSFDFDTNPALFERRGELLRAIAPLSPSDPELRRLQAQLERVTSEIVTQNYGLVLTYVRRFESKRSREDDADFEAAAVVGLMTAIASYDPSRGRFSTWAYKPIQREVLQAVRRADHPNMSATDFERRPDVQRARQALQAGVEWHEPSDAEIAVLSHTTVDQVRRILAAPGLESLSKVVGDSGEMNMAEMIEDTATAVDEHVRLQLDVAALERFGLNELEERELFVIVKRYGLMGEAEHRLSAIGKMLGLSREAVRQVEAKAIAKLNHPVILRKLVRHGRR